METKIITARTMAGKIAARAEGRWIGTRRPPLGYVKAPHPSIKDAWTLDLDPALSGTVRAAADMLTAPDGSLLKVARWLTAQGVPTATGNGNWRPAVVWAAFTNEIMIGRHYWQGDVLRDDAGMPVASFPALLSEATWRAIRARYGVPKRRTKQRDGGSAPTARHRPAARRPCTCSAEASPAAATVADR